MFNRSTLKKILSVGILILTLGLLFLFVSNNWSDFRSIRLSNPLMLLPAAILTVFNIYTTGMLLETAIIPHGIHLRQQVVLGLSSITRFSNSISPGYLGATIRGIYFKKEHGLAFARFSSSFIASNLVQLVISGAIVAIAAFSILGFDADLQSNKSFLMLIIGGVAVLTALVWAPTTFILKTIARVQKSHKHKLLERLADAVTGYKLIQSDKKLLIKLFGWASITLLCSAAILFFLYQAIGLSIAIDDLLFISALGGWGVIFSITPGNIGVREGLMAFGAKLAGVPVAETLAVSVVLRLLVVTVSALLSVYFAPKTMGAPITKLVRSAFSDKSESAKS